MTHPTLTRLMDIHLTKQEFSFYDLPDEMQIMLLQRTVRKLLADNDALLTRLQAVEMKDRCRLMCANKAMQKEIAALIEKNRRLSEQLKKPNP